MSSRSEELKEGEEGDLANGSIPENPPAKVENGRQDILYRPLWEND
jgi:hypothetical protein